MREVTFVVPYDIPTNPRAKYVFKNYLNTLPVGVWGENGEKVGIGFIWNTQTGLGEGGLNTLSRRMQRALRSSNILSPMAEPYFLEQRIDYVRDGEPSAVFTLREGP
jgi:hypothetical protein